MSSTSFTLPWKVLILSLFGLVLLQAHQLDYLGEWLYTRALPAGPVQWSHSGAYHELMLTRWMAYGVFALANAVAIVGHYLRTKMTSPQGRAKG